MIFFYLTIDVVIGAWYTDSTWLCEYVPGFSGGENGYSQYYDCGYEESFFLTSEIDGSICSSFTDCFIGSFGNSPDLCIGTYCIWANDGCYCHYIEDPFSDIDGCAACKFDTPSPTPDPTPEPTMFPTSVPTSPASFYVVQGKQQSQCLDSLDEKCITRAVSQFDIYNIRCCADTDPGGWNQNSDRGCSVFTNSKVPHCQTGDWSTAVEVCGAAGGRLCTREELEYPSLCSAGGGCGFNKYMVWSSTEGSLEAEQDQYYIVQGSSSAVCMDTEDSTCEKRAVSKDERFKVRCCADSNPGGWLQNSGCSVYTESNVPNCVSTDWKSAVELCAAAGGRLCSTFELENGCSKNGGCGFNRHMVWSSTLYSEPVSTEE